MTMTATPTRSSTGSTTATAERPSVRVLDDPRYIEAHGRLMELRTLVNSVEARINAEVNSANERRGSSLRDARAEAMSLGLPAPTMTALPMKLGELYEELATAQLAAEKARKRLEEIESRVSAEIIERIRPRYAAIARRIRAAAAELVAANEAEAELVDALFVGGVKLGALQRCAWRGINGDLRRDDLERFEKELRESLPEALD